MNIPVMHCIDKENLVVDQAHSGVRNRTHFTKKRTAEIGRYFTKT